MFSDLDIDIFHNNSLLQMLRNKIFSGYKFGKNIQNAESFQL